MDKETLEYIEGLRLDDVRESLQALLALTKVEEEIKEEAPPKQEQLNLGKLIEDAAMDATCTYHEKMKFVRGANFVIPLVREATIKEVLSILRGEEAENVLYEEKAGFGWMGPSMVAKFLEEMMKGPV